MTDHTQLPWKWHPRFEENDRNGSIYSEVRTGHAYAVAVQPRYQGNDRWEADASLIIASVNNCGVMVRALRDAAEFLPAARISSNPFNVPEIHAHNAQIDTAIRNVAVALAKIGEVS